MKFFSLAIVLLLSSSSALSKPKVFNTPKEIMDFLWIPRDYLHPNCMERYLESSPHRLFSAVGHITEITEEYKKYGEIEIYITYTGLNGEKVATTDWRCSQPHGKISEQSIDTN
jgi:hypothetical protein